MNLQNIFNDIQAADPEFGDRISPRRSVIKNMGRVASMAAIPLALGSLFKKAYGQSNAAVISVLNYALTLEYLEYEFYKAAVSANLAPTTAAAGALVTIRDHEEDHVNFLRTTIQQGLSGTAVSFTAANFDFTAGGTFANVFTNYGVMLAVAQTFEDTGVRAYKGQAEALITNDTVLEAALRIHSVEARHASHIRQMRRALGVLGGSDAKPWITGAQSNISTGSSSADAAIQQSYAGEDLATQAGVAIAGGDISNSEATEAFDEPLTRAQVEAIVDPFIL